MIALRPMRLADLSTVMELEEELFAPDTWTAAMYREELALSDDYFIEKKLFPNVDFYSGVILSAIGFPTSMFTVLFAIPRTSGWLAHWKELLEQDQKIARPKQIYTGHRTREFVPISQR